MKGKTDLAALKSLAEAMLYMDVECGKLSPLVVKHPFTDTGFVGIKDANGSFRCGDITRSESELNTFREQMKRVIDRCESAMDIAVHITNSYAFGFLKFTLPYLNQKDMTQLLRHFWTHTESPNRDPNLTKTKLLSLFQQADVSVLMDNEEYKTFCALPDTVTVYRGVTAFNKRDALALSWTLNWETATWFAHRFGELDGTVYEAQIEKAHIHALFLSRNETEVIVDPKHLQNIKTI